jgi:hypothetical protein
MSIHVCLHSWVQELELIKMLVEEDQAQLFAAWPAPGKKALPAYCCASTSAPALTRRSAQEKRDQVAMHASHWFSPMPVLAAAGKSSCALHFTLVLCMIAARSSMPST